MSMLRRLAILALVALVPLVAGCSSDVNIGAVISESGAVATYGERVKKGMDLAVEEINAAGGFKGGSFHLIYKDDATNSGRGRQVVQELIEQEGVKIVIGAVSSPVTLSIAPICQDKRIVLLSPSSSAPNITEAGDYIFRNYWRGRRWLASPATWASSASSSSPWTTSSAPGCATSSPTSTRASTER
jgi:branched-chain amino acid transport system substrate-binding protein